MAGAGAGAGGLYRELDDDSQADGAAIADKKQKR